MNKFLDLLRIILIPFIPVYAVIIYLRNCLFTFGIFNSKKVDAKIISIGNITVGGSGKTPASIYITKLFKSFGYNVGVLSRGYGRKTRGYLLVSKNGEIIEDVEKSGDEIFQTILECNVPAAVCENRVRGAQKLIEQTNVNVIILDDAFQHRWIARDTDLVLIDQKFLTSSNSIRKNLLPSGFLREPLSSLKRADGIIINRKFSDMDEIPAKMKKYFKDKIIFSAYYEAVGFIDVKSHQFYKAEEFFGQKSLVLCGIANPKSFWAALSKLKIETTNKLIFKDHKFYKQEDIKEIRKQFYNNNAQSVITTQKDAVKLWRYSKELDDIDIFYLKIEMKFDEQKKFDQFILSNIQESLGKMNPTV
jgi:tetraacyldisaccharide 4'-kinase